VTLGDCHVAVAGAGMAGLAAAIDLGRQGFQVTLLEKAAAPGGKMRRERIGPHAIDAGPTVFTMRWVFEALFADAGASLDGRLSLRKADLLARHAWRQGGRLDLFAERARSAEAIGDFAGAKAARGYLDFCKRSAAIFETLNDTFMEAQRPSPIGLSRRVGFHRLPALLQTSPYRSMWSALGQYFQDPRLRQLFGRYATYCGSSPFAAPATLMLVAHVEQEGVWLVEGGMHEVARALLRLAEEKGVTTRFGTEVAGIETDGGKVSAVVTNDGERIACDALVFNGDVAALKQGLLGTPARRALAATEAAKRSLSAVTWCLSGRAEGLDPAFHTVFFAEDYRREFAAIFEEAAICESPTVYLCAQDRGGKGAGGAPEAFFFLINAPATGDKAAYSAERIEALSQRAFGLMRDCGLTLKPDGAPLVTTPADFAERFPGTGGALYGIANHGAMASFARPGARSRLAGLYLAGGSVHPGPGIPMATLSGRLAAAAIAEDVSARR